MVSVQEIKDICYKHRPDEVHDSCLEVCNNVKDELNNMLNTDKDIGPYRVFVGTYRHQVLFIPCSEIEEYQNKGGHVLVDPTRDQFNNKNAEDGLVETSFGREDEIEEIGLYEPRHDERLFTYHDTPMGDYDDTFEYI